MADIIIFKDYLRSLSVPTSRQGQKGKNWRRQCLQGDLDGLCGVYCIINAVGRVCRLNSIHREELFECLIKALDKELPLRKFLVEGIEKKYMRLLFKAAKQWVFHRYGKTLHIEPWLKQQNISFNNYCDKLREFLNHDKRTVIIGIEGIHDHWTCVATVTAHAIYLIDSDDLSMLRLDYCRLSNKITSDYHYLGTKNTWGIRLKD